MQSKKRLVQHALLSIAPVLSGAARKLCAKCAIIGLQHRSLHDRSCLGLIVG